MSGLRVLAAAVPAAANTARYSVDLLRLVKESEAAGFNPLTVLRNGGLSAYAMQELPPVAVTPMTPFDELPVAEAPVLISDVAGPPASGYVRQDEATADRPFIGRPGAGMGGGGGEGSNFWEEHGSVAGYSGYKSASKSASRSAAVAPAAVVATLQRLAPAPTRVKPGAVGQVAGGASPAATPATQAGGSTASVAGPLKTKLKPTNTGLLMGTGWYHTNPFFSDMEEVEARLGESEFLSPAYFMGWGVTAADLIYSGQKALEYNYEQYENSLFRVEDIGTEEGRLNTFMGGVFDWWQQANSPFGPDHPIPGFTSGGF